MRRGMVCWPRAPLIKWRATWLPLWSKLCLAPGRIGLMGSACVRSTAWGALHAGQQRRRLWYLSLGGSRNRYLWRVGHFGFYSGSSALCTEFTSPSDWAGGLVLFPSIFWVDPEQEPKQRAWDSSTGLSSWTSPKRKSLSPGSSERNNLDLDRDCSYD